MRPSRVCGGVGRPAPSAGSSRPALAVRDRVAGDQGAMPLAQLLERLQEVREKKIEG